MFINRLPLERFTWSEWTVLHVEGIALWETGSTTYCCSCHLQRCLDLHVCALKCQARERLCSAKREDICAVHELS